MSVSMPKVFHGHIAKMIYNCFTASGLKFFLFNPMTLNKLLLKLFIEEKTALSSLWLYALSFPAIIDQNTVY